MAARKKTATKKKAAPKKKAAAKKKGGVSSLEVNLSHVFALRPRVETSFRPDDLRVARQRLQDESYASLPEAARAVAEKALELTNDAGRGRPATNKKR